MAPASIDASDLFGVKGLIAVVTGGGSGIGLMIAQALEANGAIVYILGRRQQTLDKAAKTAVSLDLRAPQRKRNFQGNLHPIQCDVTKKSDLERAAEEIKLKYGYVNVVIANSGVVGPSVLGMPENPSISEFKNWLWNWDPDQLNNTFAVNTAGVFYTAVAFLELLDEGNKRGHLKQRSQVIATTSIGAYVRTLVAGFGYEGSKAATTHIMKQFATSLVPYAIRANIIAPGCESLQQSGTVVSSLPADSGIGYPSDITDDLIEKQNEGGWPKDFIPEQRPGDEQDIAGAVLFLVSKAGAYINGNALVTDGGRMGILPATY
ncbi:hypothetical protein SUNI508_01569 [Seiridium unicorne]|uniref:Uncharacterized protein n=1 Tax=Seiridium unicorne TaxID=138068 RepID=A0ABR2UT59_9PEZI